MRSHPRRLPVLAALAAGVLLPACGGGDDAAEQAEQAEQAADEAQADADAALDAAAGVTFPDLAGVVDEIAGGSLPDEVADQIEDALESGSLPDLPEMAEMGSGSCGVSVAGAYSAEWSEAQNAGSATFSHWWGEQERAMLGDDFLFLANCVGEAGSLSIVGGSAADETTIPMAPGTYEIAPGGMLGGQRVFTTLVTLNGTEAVFGVAEPGGTLEITEFDEDSLALVLDIPIEDTLAAITGAPAGPSQLHAELTVSRI